MDCRCCHHCRTCWAWFQQPPPPTSRLFAHFRLSGRDAQPRWRRLSPPTLSFKNALQKPKAGDVRTLRINYLNIRSLQVCGVKQKLRNNNNPKNIIRLLSYYGFLTCLFLLHCISFSSSNRLIKERLDTNRTEAEPRQNFLLCRLKFCTLPVKH